MKKAVTISIPEELKNDAFYKEVTTICINPSDFKDWNIEGVHFFKFEILSANSIAAYLPWKHTEEALPAIIAEWNKLNEQLERLFAERNVKEAAPLMEKAVHMCFAYLFWLHHKPVVLNDWREQIEKLEFIPVNFSERMSFVLIRPAMYQSFKVIQQMMLELQKLAAIASIRRK